MPRDLTAAASRYTADDNQCQMAFLQDAFALADAMAAEFVDTPLTTAMLTSLGWINHAGCLFDKPGSPLTVCIGRDRTTIRIEGMVLVENATLGDLRTLTRILAR